MREFFPLPHVLETIFILLKEHYNLVFTLVKPQVEIYFYRQGLKERLYALFSFLCKLNSISLTRWFMGLLLNDKRQKISNDIFLNFKNINHSTSLSTLPNVYIKKILKSVFVFKSRNFKGLTKGIFVSRELRNPGLRRFLFTGSQIIKETSR